MISNDTVEQVKARINVVEVIQSFITLKKKGSEYIALCPFHNEKTPSFTVSPSKQIYKCFGCGKSGDAIAFLMEHDNQTYPQAVEWLAKKANVTIEEEQVKKAFVKPVPRLEKLSAKVLEWFEKDRMISNNTLLRFGITEAKEWMPQFEKEVNTICFNYFRSGELLNIKFRGPKKSFKLAKDAELIFYNLDAIKGLKEAIIVEGEMDCLTLHECGVFNSISVPNGAGTGNQRLQYLDNCIDSFEGVEKIILMTDADAPGMNLRDELGRRLGIDRCFLVDYPDGCKDANEVLVKRGPEAVRDVVSAARPWPIKGVVRMDEIFDTIDTWYQYGYPTGAKTRIPGFDHLLTFAPGQLTIVTGIPGHGKDEFTNWIMSSLAQNENWRWGLCGFEETPPETVTKLAEKLTGKAFGFRKNVFDRMTRKEFEWAIGTIDASFFIINPDEVQTDIDSLLKLCTQLVTRYGIKGMYINPWNWIDHLRPPGLSETEYVSQALSQVILWARKYKVHVILLAHTTKMAKEKETGKYAIPTLYSISGCHDDQTEVLTDRGWVLHKDLNRDYKVACFDLNTELIEYLSPSVYHVYPYDGDLFHFSGRQMDIMVTPEHRMIIKPHWGLKPENGTQIGRTKKFNRGWNFIQAKDVSKSPLIMPKASNFKHINSVGDKISFDGHEFETTDLFSLIGWYVSEGWISIGSFAICQADENSAMLRELIERMGIKASHSIRHYREHEKPMYVVRIFLSEHRELAKLITGECGKLSDSRKLPGFIWNGSREQKMALLESLMEGDGSISGNGFRYHTSSNRLANDISRLAFELGYKVSQNRYPGNGKWKDKFVVSFSPYKQEWLMPVNHKSCPYNGLVYCLTVPTGAYVTRRNGKVAITGNSANFFNKTHNGITVYRNYDKNVTDVYVQKVKQSWYGEIGFSSYQYNTMTRQYEYLSSSINKQEEAIAPEVQATLGMGNWKPIETDNNL